MAGSWELGTSVLIYTLHTELVSIAWAYGLRNLQVPCNHKFLPVAGQPFDMARNTACKVCLEGGFEWCLSIDSDVIPPRDGLIRLFNHRQPFISGLYNRRSPPWSVPVAIKDGQWFTSFKPDKVQEVDLVGAGFLLLHRSVIESFFKNPIRPGHPVFSWQVNYQGMMPPGRCLSEDFVMCREWIARGGKVLLDAGCKCKHIGLAESEFQIFKPLECNANA